MWKLLRSDGSVARDNLPDQWAVLRSSFKADGSNYKKIEASKVKSGTVVYRTRAITRQINYDNIKDDGTMGKAYVRKCSYDVLEKYLLVQDGFEPSATILCWFIQNSGKPLILTEKKGQ